MSQQNVYSVSNPEYFNDLRQLILSNPDNYSALFRFKKYKYLRDWIFDQIPLLQSDYYKWSTRCYWILNGMTSFPHCATCGCQVKRNVNSVNLGYSSSFNKKSNLILCSHLCTERNDVLKEIKQNTCMEHFGVSHQSRSHLVSQKIKDTCERKYGPGITNPRMAKSVIQKCVQTKRKKYNGSTVNTEALKKLTELMSSNERQEKIQKIIFNKFGASYPFQLKEFRDKARQTCFQNNGYYYPLEMSYNRTKYLNKYYFNGIKFDSSWELAFYIWLVDNKYDFIYQCDFLNLHYEDDNGKLHQYIPDFYLYDFDVIIEIKGDWFFNNRIIFKNQDCVKNGKIKCMEDNNVVIFKYKEIKDFIKYVKTRYGAHFLKECKV